MKIKELLNYGTAKLKENNIENANLQAKILLSHIINKPKEYLIINQDEEQNRNIEQEYTNNIEKLINGYPLQYITNTQEFMKLDFYVDENVLIPQPDTEILVEEIIKISSKEKKLEILDMCTGSGVIAIALAKYIKNSKIYAVDISEKALEIAQKNAIKNKVEEQITFIKSDMFKNVPNKKFDIIVSNPPYIETSVIDTLSKQVKHEPHIALDGGIDGLDFYKIISENASKFLKENGILGLEIGYNQTENVTKILSRYKEIYCKKDLSNNDRIIISRM